ASPAAVRPVFEAILRRACALCEADGGILSLREGETLSLVAQHNFSSVSAGIIERIYPIHLSRNTMVGRAARERAAVNIGDVLAEEGYALAEFAEQIGVRALL